MKQTVLNQKHELLKAKMGEFQGWQVPIQFADLQNEYQAVRSAAGLFDIGFLGRIEVSGASALDFLQSVVTVNVARIAEGSSHYALIVNESGFILDDCILFHLASGKLGGSRYLLTTNAVNTDKVLLWLRQHIREGVQITDRSPETGQFALQGPHTLHVLEALTGRHFKKMKPRAVREMALQGVPGLVARSSFTGELGYELVVPAASAAGIWDALLAAGKDHGLLPCGLAVRDVLRIEMGCVLYGNEIDESRTPFEAGLSSFVDLTKDFIGKEALLPVKTRGAAQKLAGFVLLDKGVPKIGGSIFSESREIGVVTSGCQSLHLKKGIGLGYVVSRYAQPDQEIEIEIRDREITAKIAELPFYKKK